MSSREHTFKVGDKVSYLPFEGEVWILIDIRSTNGTIAYKESTYPTWEVSGHRGYPPEYTGYNGWNVALGGLTLVQKANPIWLRSKE